MDFKRYFGIKAVMTNHPLESPDVHAVFGIARLQGVIGLLFIYPIKR
jgi:hypothetical protein